MSASTLSQQAQVGQRAVDRLREYVSSGSFARLTEIEPNTGEVKSSEARTLFASLPSVTPMTSVDELVESGLIRSGPRRLHLAYQPAKYAPGRELFVYTHANHARAAPHRAVGEYDADAPLGFTHQAVLRARRGEDFVVTVEGSPRPLAFARTDILAWNEPCGVSATGATGATGGRISGVQVDYNDPLWKAQVCAGYLDIAEELARIDFGAEDATDRQVRLIHRVASRVSMKYSGRGEGYSGHRAGALMSGGQGVCFVQRAVAGAYLQAFAPILGFEVQMAIGRTLRLGVPHGFVVVLIRPSMKRFVCDPAWSEPLTSLRVAFFGPRWGQDRRLVGLEGEQDLRVASAEEDLPEVTAS